MKKVSYFGERDGLGVCRVWVSDGSGLTPLDLGLKTRAHSPMGFNWGYAGSGPAQLSLAILLHCFNSAREAMRVFQDFKFEVIAKIAFDRWELTQEEVWNWYLSSLTVKSFVGSRAQDGGERS